MTIGSRLKEERQKLKLTQQSFGGIGGVGKTTQVLYETGARVPDANYLIAIAEAGVDIHYVLLGVRLSEASAIDLDEDILGQILEAIEIWSSTRKVPADPALKAKLAHLFYRQFKKDKNVDHHLITEHLRLVG